MNSLTQAEIAGCMSMFIDCFLGFFEKQKAQAMLNPLYNMPVERTACGVRSPSR